MIPKYLLSNPFPDSKWSPEMRPVAVIDGEAYSIEKLDEKITGEIAYFAGVNEKNFQKVVSLFAAKVMHFYEMRVSDISGLCNCESLEELAIHWNTKLADISPIKKMTSLKSLVLEDTPKVSDLTPLENLAKLEILEYSGGMWKKNTTASLEPISRVGSLKKLRLLNLGVKEGGLFPLSKLNGLEELEISNQFPTEEYAYLSVHLSGVKCSHFSPYVKVASPIDGKDVMIVGKRKPFLSLENDAEKVSKYVMQFEKMRAKYAANNDN